MGLQSLGQLITAVDWSKAINEGKVKHSELNNISENKKPEQVTEKIKIKLYD